METLDNFFQEPENILVNKSLFQNSKQNFMIDRGEKLSNITLEHPTGFGMVLTLLASEFLKVFDGSMRTFFVPTGIRVSDEGFVEEWVEDTIECMVQESIADGGFVNVSRFRVGDCEGVIAGVTVDFCAKLSVEHENIVH